MLSRNFRAALSLQSRSRFVHTTPALFNTKTSSSSTLHSVHTTDSYSKDVDSTPPSDPKMHRVDPSSENAQKPYEPPSGEWSQASTKHTEYQSTSKAEPYQLKGKDQRYGGKEEYAKEKGSETSRPEDGPEGKESRGRKPEGR